MTLFSTCLYATVTGPKEAPVFVVVDEVRPDPRGSGLSGVDEVFGLGGSVVAHGGGRGAQGQPTQGSIATRISCLAAEYKCRDTSL